MRLSKRERFLLAVLTLLLLWTGFYKFWIEPETDLLFANLQEINRLEEQIKRGGPQGKQNLEQTAEKLEQAGNGQIYFADMSPEKMDRKLLQLAGETGIQLSGVETGETKEMDTAGYVYTPLTLEFVCTDREQAAGFVEKINQEEGTGSYTDEKGEPCEVRIRLKLEPVEEKAYVDTWTKISGFSMHLEGEVPLQDTP